VPLVNLQKVFYSTSLITFNKPPFTGNEEKYIIESIKSNKISGDGKFTKKCSEWFEKNLQCKKALLTTSCTHALEMTAILLDIKEGDEVIMPSYTFVSTANAFVLRGAKIVFVDIRPDTMNIDETKIEDAITDKTKVIVPVHYAGVACEMDAIMDIASRHNLFVVEDAAQGMMSSYKGKPLGTIGHFGTFSFHETKNYTSGEGGLLIINDEKFVQRAEIIREKGTNRSLFFRGMVDKYSWVDIGSSYLMNDVSAAYLWGNLEKASEIRENRLNSWNSYNEGLRELKEKGLIELPTIPDNCIHNAHMFYIKVKDLSTRSELLEYLKEHDIGAVFHYIPLHSAPAGIKFGVFDDVDEFTTKESERLIRLPMYYGLDNKSIAIVVKTIENYIRI
jgi:dTDP-4-amino-4,6-dideoxygalactose transaminase